MKNILFAEKRTILKANKKADYICQLNDKQLEAINKSCPTAIIDHDDSITLNSGDYLVCDIVRFDNRFSCQAFHDGKMYVFIGYNALLYSETDLEEVKSKSEKMKAKNAEPKYVIKNPDGKLFKDKKYKKLSDVFAGMMIECGYHDLFQHLSSEEKYQEKNPELGDYYIPDWLFNGYYRDATPENVKGLEVHKYFGAKIPTEKVEVDYYEKIKWHFDNILIAMEYGLVTKDIFKKMSDNQDFTYQFILVYSPTEYFDKKFYNFESLKEDDVIKDLYKKVKKIALKTTRYGKTAVAFKNMEDMSLFYDNFPDEYKSRTRLITLESGKRGCEVMRDGNIKEEVRMRNLEDLLAFLD